MLKFKCKNFFDQTKGTYNVSDEILNSIKGKSIVKIQDCGDTNLILILDDGTRLIVESNEGCGGCDNGWFYHDLEKVLSLGLEGNVITDIKVKCDFNDDDEGTYTVQIYSLDKRYNIECSGHDNGYYGIGISLNVYIDEK